MSHEEEQQTFDTCFNAKLKKAITQYLLFSIPLSPRQRKTDFSFQRKK